MSYWSANRFVVTGGTGFLGSYVVEKLKQKGALEVHALGSGDYDLREQSQSKALLAALKPSVIIHLAATVGGIGANRQRPADFFYENLMMGIHLFHEAWKEGVEKFVTIGTVCAYPKFTPVPFDVNDLWNGYPEETNAPYGLAKKMLLVQGQAYREQYGFNSIYLLPTNLYGPGDNFSPDSSHVIPALIKKFVEAKDQGLPLVTVWGTGSPTREFLYVEDAAEAIIMATERYNAGEPVNIGSGFEISIKSLAEMIADMVGFSGDIIWDSTMPDGQPRRGLNVKQAYELFGFQAKTEFKEGIRNTIDHYPSSLRETNG